MARLQLGPRVRKAAAGVGIAGALTGGTVVTTQAAVGRCGGRSQVTEHDTFLTRCFGLGAVVHEVRCPDWRASGPVPEEGLILEWCASNGELHTYHLWPEGTACSGFVIGAVVDGEET